MMKKIAMILAISAMLQGLAFAASYTSYTDLGTVLHDAGVSYKPSNNVGMLYKNDGATKPQLYTIGAKNTSGDTVYATSNMSGNIYKYTGSTDTKAGKTIADVSSVLPANAGESTGWGTDWTAI